MSGSILLSGPKIMRLRELLVALAKQQLRIPRFQRPFVWRDDQRLELLESIYRGMPIGSILVWSTDQALACYERLGRFRFEEVSGRAEYVLDGHQRLTTLFGALVPGALAGFMDAPIGGYAEYDEDGGAAWPIYFDLREERFTLARGSSQETPERLLLSMDQALDSFKLIDFQRDLLLSDAGQREPEEYKKYANRAQYLNRVFSDYQIPIIPLMTDELASAAEAFRRVNAAGTKMSEAHLIHALTFERELRLLERLDDVRHELTPLGWGGLQDEVLLKLLKLRLGMDSERANPQGLVEKIGGAGDVALSEVARGFMRAVSFLAEHLGIYGPKLLPYEMQLVLLADALCEHEGELSKRAIRELTHWFWRTTAGGGEFPKIKQQQVMLRRCVRLTGSAEAERSKREKLVMSSQFNAQSASGKVWMLLLAKQAQRHKRSAEEDPLKVLGREGMEASWRMRGADADDVAGRFYVPLADQPRFEEKLTASNAPTNFLERHLLPKVPYRMGRWEERSAESRASKLKELWRAFWAEQGFDAS